MAFRIITCPQWGARPPLHGFDSIVWTPRPAEIVLFHHTAGHHQEISNPKDESYAEALRYVRQLQIMHQSPSATDPSKPWNDSGQNFTITRNGLIFQGRWRTVRAIQHKRMVMSAHCPRFNDQIGIEHEHLGNEEMTKIQKEASAWLQAWIAKTYDKNHALRVEPHSRYFNTSCPANLIDDIEPIREMANRLLRKGLV